MCRYGALGANTKIGWPGYLNKYSDKVPPTTRTDVGDVIMLTKEMTGLIDVWAAVYPSHLNVPSRGVETHGDLIYIATVLTYGSTYELRKEFMVALIGC